MSKIGAGAIILVFVFVAATIWFAGFGAAFKVVLLSVVAGWFMSLLVGIFVPAKAVESALRSFGIAVGFTQACIWLVAIILSISTLLVWAF